MRELRSKKNGPKPLEDVLEVSVAATVSEAPRVFLVWPRHFALVGHLFLGVGFCCRSCRLQLRLV